MGWRLAWAVSVCVAIVACGGRTDLTEAPGDDGGALDASTDAKPKKDAAPDVVEAGYVPLGKKCGAPTGPAPTPWTPNDAGAPIHPPLAASSGGSILANPVFVPITFDGDDMRDPIEDFVGSVGCTAYWESIVRDYGVNDAYTVGVGHLSTQAPAQIDDAQISTFIRSKIVSKDLPYPTANTLYVIFYPDGTDITLQGSTSCQSFGGYHNEFAMTANLSVAYAVIPRCGGFGQMAGIDELTATTSHELVEAVTDPFPFTYPAYQLPEASGIAWALAGGGEIGDLCEFNHDAFYSPSDYPFAVQHQWVNHMAWAGHDPCQPTSTTYVVGAPVLPDTITYDIGLGAADDARHLARTEHTKDDRRSAHLGRAVDGADPRRREGRRDVHGRQARAELQRHAEAGQRRRRHQGHRHAHRHEPTDRSRALRDRRHVERRHPHVVGDRRKFVT